MIIKTIEDLKYPITNSSYFNEIKNGILDTIIRNEGNSIYIRQSRNGSDMIECYIYGQNTFDKIRPFTQPLVVYYDDREYVCVDVRPYIRIGQNGETIAKPIEELTRKAFECSMANAWSSGMYTIFRTDYKFAGKIFVESVSQILMRTWNMNITEVPRAKTIAAFYYGSMMRTESEWKDLGNDAANRAINAWLPFKHCNLTEELKETVGYVSDIDDFIEKLKANISSPRVSANLSKSAFLEQWARLAFGPWMDEVLLIGLEIPYAWTAVVATVSANRGMRNTSIGKTIERFKKKPEYDDFTQTVKGLVIDPLDMDIYKGEIHS